MTVKPSDLAERTTNGRAASSQKARTRAFGPDTRHPPAVTVPGERWHLNGFILTSVIIVRDGPDANGRNYIDGRHQVTVGSFHTVRDAAAAVQGFNGFNLVAELYEDCRSAADFYDKVGDLLTSYGRVPE